MGFVDLIQHYKNIGLSLTNKPSLSLTQDVALNLEATFLLTQ